MAREIWLEARQVRRITGLTYPQLDYMLRSGAVTCTDPGGGPGIRRRFSFTDVLRMRAVLRLRAEGISLAKIREATDLLARVWGEDDPLLSGLLVVVGDELYFERDAEQIVNVLTGQSAMKQVLVIDMGRLAEETRQELAKAA